jgi:hypothetical protein
MEEGAEHTHGGACYQTVESIVCGSEENAGHAHSDGCYTVQDVLVCELSEQGVDNGTIASKAAVQPFIVGKILRQLKGGFSRKVLIKALKDCVNIENDIKNGRMDEKAGVEMILIKYS